MNWIDESLGRAKSLPSAKKPIKFNIPEGEAVERLVDLIREHGKWVEPEPKEHASLIAH